MKLLLLLALCCIACGDDDALDASVDASQDASLEDGGVGDGSADASIDSSMRDATPIDGAVADATDADPCRSIRNVSDLPAMLDEARCEDGVAIVCDSDTESWRRTTCESGTRCETYTVTVYENVGDDLDSEYVAAFDTVGADCIPEDAEACTWTVLPEGLTTTEFEDGCTADLRRECRRARVENVYISSNGAFAATERGWVLDTPCEDDESCRLGYCVEDELVLCNSFGFESTCTGDVLHTCIAGDPFDYEGDVDCAARGATCEATCGSGPAACIGTEREPCDPATFVPVCAGGDAVTTCQFDCYTRTTECGEQFYEGAVVETYCGTSYDVYAGHPDTAMGACLPEGVSTCVPSELTERCEGDTSVTCDGLVRRIACPMGQECTLVDGNAGCAVSASASCTDTDLTCEGNLLVGCCEEGRDWVYGLSSFWCQPGLQYVIEDCSELGRSCVEDTIFDFAECR